MRKPAANMRVLSRKETRLGLYRRSVNLRHSMQFKVMISLLNRQRALWTIDFKKRWTAKVTHMHFRPSIKSRLVIGT